MKYRYDYTTNRREAGTKEFEDLFPAIHYMNSHLYLDCDIIVAEIYNLDNKQIVCASRKVR